MAQLLGLQGPWWHQVCRDMDCLHRRSYYPIRVSFWASCSWWSGCLFGQSFSVAPPIQTVRGLPCLGSFSVVWHLRHIEGLPWLGSYSVVQCLRRLMGLLFSCQCWRVWGRREAMVMALHTKHDSAVSPCFHGCLAFLHRHFPPQSPPSQPLNLFLRSQLQPSPGDCSTIPKLQLLASAVRGMYGCGKDVWISFCLGCHRLAVSLSSLNVLWLRQLPQCGDRSPASVPPPVQSY